MNYQIPPDTALRVKDKLDEYLKLIARLNELGKDPDLSVFKHITSKPNYNPSKPAMKYVEEVFSSLPEETLLDTYELIDKMKDIGYWSSAEKIYLTVYGSLRRESKKANSHLVKVGSKWKWTTITTTPHIQSSSSP